MKLDEGGGRNMAADVNDRRVEFDYLRAFVVALVVWHHAILAYHTFAYLNPGNPAETFSPVVDSQRWGGFDLIADFNDTFFMALMFLVSGLFAWPSLSRKGVRGYLSDRFRRIGIPFAIGVPLLIPLAYYPAQLEVNLVFGSSASFGELWLGIARSGFHSPGPLWFLWLLLAFDCVLAAPFQVVRYSGIVPGGLVTAITERPAAFVGTLLAVSTAVYLPVVLTAGPLEWIGVGPFVAQTSRIGVYLVYFLAGAALGARGLSRSVLQPGGPLAGRWWAWPAAGLVSFAVSTALAKPGAPPSAISELAFTVTCAALSIGAIAICLRFATHRVRVLDSLAENSFGIYVVHYAAVTWLQYWLIGTGLSAMTKATVVFAGALFLSWGVIASVRRVPVVAMVI